MPKLIDYPRTSYPGAWEIAEVVDDTGGKCALETAARKLNRKVSGSFKAIIGSAVKFGLLTSKREMLTTTTLFRRIKHAYDKQEELLFHREAFLTPPLFTQLCRKFRSRELPVAMLDVLLIREFDVEEINAQNVAKAFVDGARMVGLLDEQNTVADIDQLAAQQPPRRELASPAPAPNRFRNSPSAPTTDTDNPNGGTVGSTETTKTADKPGAADSNGVPELNKQRPPQQQLTTSNLPLPSRHPAPAGTSDAIANLFGLGNNSEAATQLREPSEGNLTPEPATQPESQHNTRAVISQPTQPVGGQLLFQLQITGPGINTALDVVDADDLALVRALLDKIERQLRR